jgi:predicted GNAT superfamily acetyltransferase
MSKIEIRSPRTPLEIIGLQQVQRRAWGIVDDSYILPVSTLVAVHHHGGLVLGAFTDEGKAVGLSFAFLGRIDGRLCLYSQLTGVIPGYQGNGLGSRMKAAQREFCREQGIGVIAWAFDPMQANNAWFNLQKLGAMVRRFYPDMYGPRTDALNVGAPTDRIIAEWELDAVPPASLTAEEIGELPRMIHPGPFGNRSVGRTTDAGLPLPWSSAPEGPRCLLEIPASIGEMRRDRPSDALYWQALVGSALIGAFEMGYRAVGFARDSTEGEMRCFYVLELQTNA